MENQTDEIAVEEVQTEEVAAKPEVTEIEEKALKMGWTPKDQFRGDPDKWRDAQEFVERGENMLPIVQARVKQQEREINELKETMKEFAEFHSKTEQRAYAQAVADLKQQRANAIAAGDGAAFDKVDDALETLRKEMEAKTQQTQRDAGDEPWFVEWKSANKWYDEPKTAAYADSVAEFLRRTGETATGIEFLELVKTEVKQRFPEKFENPRRTAAPTVEGGVPAPRKGGKSYADMPAEARAACDRMAKNMFSGSEKQAADFKAAYVKQYFEEA